MSSTTPVGLDAFPVSSDEAVELTIHHLKLAAMFFMNTPDDGGEQLQEEIVRQIENRSPFRHTDEVALASREFLAFLIDHYENSKDEAGQHVERVLLTGPK